MPTKVETVQCEKCFKETEYDLCNAPAGWYAVPNNVSVFVCPECVELAVRKYLKR